MVQKILDQITGLVGLVVLVKVLPLITGLVGGLGGGAATPVTQTPAAPQAGIDVFASQESLAAASVIPGTPIGVGQQDFAVPVEAPNVAIVQQAQPADRGPEQAPSFQQTVQRVEPEPVFGPVFSLPEIYGGPPDNPPPQEEGWEAGRIIGHRFTGGVEYNIVSTGVGFGVERIAV